jgi:hypothetical protein
MKYIFGAKPGDHKALFDAVEASEDTQYHELLDDKGFLHQFRYLNDVALNKSNPDVRVNFLEYMQTRSEGQRNSFFLGDKYLDHSKKCIHDYERRTREMEN